MILYLPRLPVGGLLSTDNLWNNQLEGLPDNDCNKALNHGAYKLNGDSVNRPSSFSVYGHILVFGNNAPGNRLTQMCFSDAGEFAYRSRTIPVTGAISEFGIEWVIK